MQKTLTHEAKKGIPYAKVDPEMEKYQDMVLFPEKLAVANEVLRTKMIPEEMRPKVSSKK
jgi:hypothetical protein